MKSNSPMILIGTSTGGPGVVRKILQEIPRWFRGTIVVAQHIHTDFLPGLADWLSSSTGHKVVIAQNGEVVKEGIVYLAGAHANLGITSLGTFVYHPPTKNQVYIPSIDAVFRECSREFKTGLAAVLTGMGEDGASGLGKLKGSGWRTIVQEGSSCIVNGMPAAALQFRADHEIMEPEKLGQVIRGICSPLSEVVCQQKVKSTLAS